MTKNRTQTQTRKRFRVVVVLPFASLPTTLLSMDKMRLRYEKGTISCCQFYKMKRMRAFGALTMMRKQTFIHSVTQTSFSRWRRENENELQWRYPMQDTTQFTSKPSLLKPNLQFTKYAKFDYLFWMCMERMMHGEGLGSEELKMKRRGRAESLHIGE